MQTGVLRDVGGTMVGVLVVVDRNTARLSNDGKQRLRKQVSVVLRKKGLAVASA